jgi:hypothetical protein
VTTEHAGVPQACAVAQQVHHETTALRPPQEAHPARLTAAATAPTPDSSTVTAIGKALSCLLRPYPIDDADPRATRRRIATAGAGVVGAVAAGIAVRRRARRP